MLLHTEPDLIYKSFHHELDHAFQTNFHIEHTQKMLLLTVIHRLRAPLIMLPLAGNHMTSCRDTDKII